MSAVTSEAAVDGYYAAWRGVFDEPALGGLLADDLEFEGPIAGHRFGAQPFIGGLRRFVEGLRGPIEVVQDVRAGAEAAVVYDAHLPGGTMRFAEFFRLEGDRITRIVLLYDAHRYVELGGR